MPTVTPTRRAKPAKLAPIALALTPMLINWREWRDNGHRTNDLKQKLREFVSNNVDETNRYAGRFATLIYVPDQLKTRRELFKAFGDVITKMFRDKVEDSDAAAANHIAFSAEDRQVIVTLMRGKPRLNALLNGSGRTWFICQYTGYVTKTSDALHSRVADIWFAPNAAVAGTFRQSRVMNDYIPRGDAMRFAPSMTALRQGDWDWVTRAYAADNSLRFVDRSSAYTTEAVAEELGLSLLNEDGNAIGGYHSSKHIVGKIPSAYDKRKLPLLLGLELEMENATSGVSTSTLATEWLKKFAVITVNGKKHRYCATEHDGSLSNGFECVTGYTGLDVHEQALLPLKDAPFKGKLNSHNTTTCGLHVHIDRMSITPLHAYKLNLFINAKENQSLVYAVARRYNHDRYAAMAPKEGDGKIMGDYVRRVRADLIAMKGNTARTRKEFSNVMRERYSDVIKQANPTRYQAVNFNNSKTLEYRLYRGSLKYETIMACLEFTRATWLFSYQFSRTDMNTAAFLKFISLPENRQDTKFLREYLTLKGFDTKERTDVQVPAGRLTQKVIESEDAGEFLPKPKANKLHQLQGQAA